MHMRHSTAATCFGVKPFTKQHTHWMLPGVIPSVGLIMRSVALAHAYARVPASLQLGHMVLSANKQTFMMYSSEPEVGSLGPRWPATVACSSACWIATSTAADLAAFARCFLDGIAYLCVVRRVLCAACL